MLTDTKVAAIKPPPKGQQEHADAKVTGLRLRVGSSGKKSWIVRRRAGEKLINRKLGTYPAMGLARARDAALKVIEELEREGTTEALDRTFGQLAQSWIDKKEADKRRNRSRLQQQRCLEIHVLPKWKNRKLSSIKRADVRSLIAGIEGEIVPNRVLTIVKTVFRHGLSHDWIEASPAEGITKPNQENVRDRWLDMGELKRLWAATALMGYPFGSFVRMLLLTAQRRTEVASMRWASVDLDEGTWFLAASDTKGDRQHLVPLTAPAVALLKELPRLGPFVFTSDGESHISAYAKYKALLDKYIEASDGPLEPWRLHDLRRTASTHMARLGVLREIRSRVLNHAVEGVTDRHYTPYDFAPDKRRALELWANELMRAVDATAVQAEDARLAAA